jgi:hypothetical protein
MSGQQGKKGRGEKGRKGEGKECGPQVKIP